jgi:arylsulfatase
LNVSRKIPPLLAMLLAGLWAGSLVGVMEAGLVVLTSAPPEEYGLWIFAVVSYGLLGMTVAAAGLPIAWFAQIRRSLAVGAWLGSVPLSFLVSRYYVAQRVFGEQLPMRTPTGVAVHAALLLFAVLLGTVLAFVFGLAGKREGWRNIAFLGVGWGLFAGLVAWGVQLAAPLPRAPARVATAGTQRPNVVLFVIDTLRADALGPYGAPPGQTPNIDALAREAVVFRNAYAQSSWTRPSIATILTGLYPSEHGAVRKLDPLPDSADTLAEFFQRRGYWTAAFVTNINVAPIFNFDQGFGEYHYLAPSFYFGASDSATRLASYKILRLLRERFWKNRIYYQHYYQDAHVVTNAVRSWLDEQPPEPFFLLIHYMDPHDPYFEIPYNGRGIARVVNPFPDPSQAQEMRRLYAQEVQYLDQELGALVEDLRRRGLLDRSWLLLTADHGEEFYEHGGWWHGTTLYEEQIRVPLLLRGPAGRATPAIHDGFALTIDIFPTLVQAAGFAPPKDLRGVDLLQEGAMKDRIVFAEEELEGNRLAAIRVGAEKLIVANPGNPRGLGEWELYDLERDPHERENLAEARPERVAELRGTLNAFRLSLQSGRSANLAQ